MSKDVLKGRWKQLKGEVRGWWAKLSDDDVGRIEGDSEKLLGILQEKYGYGREKAEQELNEFLSRPEGQRRRAS